MWRRLFRTIKLVVLLSLREHGHKEIRITCHDTINTFAIDAPEEGDGRLSRCSCNSSEEWVAEHTIGVVTTELDTCTEINKKGPRSIYHC